MGMEEIRTIRRGDLKRVLEIEKAAFSVIPWNEEDFLTAMRCANSYGVVYCWNGTILGYMFYSLIAQRAAIINLTVDPIATRRGIGRKLVSKLSEGLAYFKKTGMVALVGEWNTGTHLFLKSLGWKADKVIRDHFESGKFPSQTAYRFVWTPDWVTEHREGIAKDKEQANVGTD